MQTSRYRGQLRLFYIYFGYVVHPCVVRCPMSALSFSLLISEPHKIGTTTKKINYIFPIKITASYILLLLLLLLGTFGARAYIFLCFSVSFGFVRFTLSVIVFRVVFLLFLDLQQTIADVRYEWPAGVFR